MIPEEFSLSNLEFDEFDPDLVRLRTKGIYYPVLYSSSKKSFGNLFEYDIDGFRTPKSMKANKFAPSEEAKKFYYVYEEHFEDYKLAIQKLLVKDML